MRSIVLSPAGPELWQRITLGDQRMLTTDASGSRMKRTYVLAIVCEVVTVAALWWFGRAFSS